ncbi:MAG: hypothetical protein VR67_01885 [Peptococcaceae bacterium BRH_c8a]|nr:MAG: hypothetical protein VR67_01885 [Peptococcaceae bacterium BRH_c8a]
MTSAYLFVLSGGAVYVRVFVAEDNLSEMKHLRQLLAGEADLDIVGEAYDGDKALKLINELKPEVAFLDITMPGISGMELAGMIDQSVQVVFITAHHDYAINAFELGSVDYILKPVDQERLSNTLHRIRRSKACALNETLTVSVKNEAIILNIRDIIFIEKQQGHKQIIIYTYDNQLFVNLPLNNLESRLARFGFVRTHKSFLVNINKLERLLPWGHKSYLAKLNGTQKEVIISRKYAPAVKAFINGI